MAGRAVEAQHLRDLARLRRVRDRIDREFAQLLLYQCATRRTSTTAVWPTAFAATERTAAVEARIAAVVKEAVR